MTQDRVDNRQRVLDATDIVAIIGEHLALKPKGREYVALCPFHDDHKPSMSVVPHKQIFCCFSCGAAGNAIDFVMRFHSMDFRGALELLAQRAGVELQPIGRSAASGGPDGATSREDLLAAASFAQGFFKTILAHPEHGSAARSALERRGITPDMIERFGLGAAPDRWDRLLKTLQAKGSDPLPLLQAGLLKPRADGSAYDGFRHRLIFPICDALGRPVAFGGRKLRDEDEPKYLNSPESAIFDKGSILYALPQASRAIQASRTAVITEGYVDALTCHQFGFTNVVATLGTALTPKHAAQLRRMADTVVLLFDGDEAGQRAADRAFTVFLNEPVDVKVAILPDDLDPDDLLRSEGGPDRFRAVLAAARDAIEYRYERLTRGLSEDGRRPGSAARQRLVQDDLAMLAELGLNDLQPIRRKLILEKLARLGGVDVATVVASIPRIKRSRGVERAESPAPVPAAQAITALDHALGCILLEPELLTIFSADAEDLLKRHAYGDGPFRGLATVCLEHLASGTTPTTAGLIESSGGAAVRAMAASLAARVNEVTDHSPDRLMSHWTECVRRVGLDEPIAAMNPGDGTVAAAAADGDALASLADQLDRLRRKHQAFGGDPLAHPNRLPAGV